MGVNRILEWSGDVWDDTQTASATTWWYWAVFHRRPWLPEVELSQAARRELESQFTRSWDMREEIRKDLDGGP